MIALSESNCVRRTYSTLVILTVACVSRIHGFSSISAVVRGSPCLSKGCLLPPKSLSALRASSDSQTQEELDSARATGILVLLTVPFAWGSFEPATRYVYSMDPPLPAFVFSLAYYSVAAASLILASVISDQRRELLSDEKGSSLASHSSRGKPLWPTAGGVELGLYLFIGNALQVFGLKTVPSDRAAFLLQLTTIFVPLLEASFARDWTAVSRRTWIACSIALGGVGVISLDEEADLMHPSHQLSPFSIDWPSLVHSWSFSSGDALVVAAAIAYSFHCIRLEGYAQTTPAVALAVSKASTETFCSALALLTLVGYASATTGSSSSDSSGDNLLSSFAKESGEEIFRFMSYLTNESPKTEMLWSAALAILWTGLVTVAYTIYAQSYGQRRVRPATANLIYTIQPVCTALFAWVLLGESLGPAGYFGGALIGAAVLIVAVPQQD